MNKERRKYSKEFKKEAMELHRSSGKSMAEIERALGMSKGLLKQWIRQAKEAGESAFPGQGRQPALEEEVRRLRRENAVLKQEREILKKALGIVSDKPRMHTSS